MIYDGYWKSVAIDDDAADDASRQCPNARRLLATSDIPW